VLANKTAVRAVLKDILIRPVFVCAEVTMGRLTKAGFSGRREEEWNTRGFVFFFSSSRSFEFVARSNQAKFKIWCGNEFTLRTSHISSFRDFVLSFNCDLNRWEKSKQLFEIIDRASMGMTGTWVRNSLLVFIFAIDDKCARDSIRIQLISVNHCQVQWRELMRWIFYRLSLSASLTFNSSLDSRSTWKCARVEFAVKFVRDYGRGLRKGRFYDDLLFWCETSGSAWWREKWRIY
jgi:hypothetical protein